MAKFEEIKGLEQFPNITRKLNSVELLLESDPDSAAAAMRTAMEMMLKDLCRKYTGEEGADNSERINALEEKSVISADMKDALHDLRKSGNATLHEGWQIETYDAERWYSWLLDFARIFAAEADPASAVNRGIRVDSKRSIVFLNENITALGTMPQEERSRMAMDTLRELKEFISRWQYRQKHASAADLEPQQEWLAADEVYYNYYYERFEIPNPVQEYFALYDLSGFRGMLSAVDASCRGFDCRPVQFRPFVEERLKYTDVVGIPPAVRYWGEIQIMNWDDDVMLGYVEKHLLDISSIRRPSYLLNDGFTGGDGTGRRSMHLLENEFDLVLPDDFPCLQNPDELRLLLIYFPYLRSVTWLGKTWNCKEILAADQERYLRLFKKGNLDLHIPSGKNPADDRYTALPKTLTENCPDMIYYLFTLFYSRIREIRLIPGARLYPADPCEPGDPQVREYVLNIDGDPVQWLLNEAKYPNGLDKGISCEKATIKSPTEFTIRRKYLWDIRRVPDNFVVLPDWVLDGAVALNTDVESFLNAVLKIRPELLDVEREPEDTAPVQKKVWKFCPYCGKELMPGSVFCSECGKRLPEHD